MISTFFVLIFSIFSVIILLIALFSPVARKIGFRNITRRISNTFLVILGSMVGSALISGSLVLSDSLDATFLKFVENELGEIDAQVKPSDKIPNEIGIPYFEKAEADSVKSLYTGEEFDGTLAGWNFNFTVQKLDSQDKPEFNIYNVSVIAFDFEEAKNFGQNKQVIPNKPQENEIIITRTLSQRLKSNVGEKIRIPYAGNTYDFTIAEIYEDKGIIGGSTMLFSKDNFTSIFSLPSESSNTILVSAKGGIKPDNYSGTEFKKVVDEKLKDFKSERISVNAVEMKQDALEGYGLSSFVVAFLALSMFGIFAGILLIVNLYAMLAEERKYEMGILRAIALTKMQLTKTFIFEGYLYSVLSSLVGAFVGLGVGYLLVNGLDGTFKSLFSSAGDDYVPFSISFGFSTSSLVIAFCAGAIITIITSIFTSFRISNLNIVSAIRDLEEVKEIKINIRWILTSIFYLILTLISGLMFLYSLVIDSVLKTAREQDSQNPLAQMSDEDFNAMVDLSKSYTFYIGVIALVFFIIVLINRFASGLLKKNISRYTQSIGAIFAVGFTMGVSSFDFVSNALEQDAGAVLFFIFGGVSVIGFAVLISNNLDIISNIVSFILSPLKSISSVVKISMRYPAENPSRTGLTLVMFALIIYLIVYTSFNKSLANQATSNLSDNAFSGFDVAIYPGFDIKTEQMVEIKSTINQIENVDSSLEIISTSVILPEYKYKDLAERPYFGDPALKPVFQEEDAFKTYFDAFSSTFLKESNVELASIKEGYNSAEEVWETVANDKTKVVLGSSFTGDITGRRPDIKVGEIISISDKFETKSIEVEVIGIIGNNGASGGSSSTLYQNIVTSEEGLTQFLEQDYIDSFSTRQLLVELKDENNPGDSITQIRKSLINYNISSIFEVSELSQVAQNFINGIILLLQGFLAFSLVVGASGLAIIMTRSVHERRQQIGMLRSLGFQRWMILLSFFIETTFITFLGIIIGISMGTVGSYSVFRVISEESRNLAFDFPIMEISIISLLIYIASLLFALLPSLKAASLSPVEATNYPE